jgi:hypothetical protein
MRENEAELRIPREDSLAEMAGQLGRRAAGRV